MRCDGASANFHRMPHIPDLGAPIPPTADQFVGTPLLALLPPEQAASARLL